MRIFKRGGFISFLVGSVLLLAMLALGITTETPMGSVAGSVRMSENGLALPNSVIIVSPMVEDEDMPKPRVIYADKSGEFKFMNLPAGDYKIEASAKVHRLDPTTITVKEGLTTSVDLELKPEDPSFRLYTAQRVFLPDEKAQVEAHGFGADTDVSVKVYKIDLSKFLDKGSIYGVLYSISNSSFGGDAKKDPSSVGALVSKFNHRVQNSDAEGTFMDVIDLKKLKEGFYWVECNYGALKSGAFLNISSIALVTKSSPGKMLCFVTDLKSGKPVPNVPLSLNEANAWTPFAKTDADGIAKFALPGKGRKMLVLATQGSSQAVSAFYLYGSGDNPTDYYEGDEGQNGGPPAKTTTVFAYTDRPIYRPGDEIQFKGFARTRVGSQYNLPGPGTVSCEIRDLEGNLVKTLDLPMDANGAFHGNYQTNEENAPGLYTISITALGQQKDLYFTLAAYRKPEFTIKVTWSQPHYTMGEKLKATVHCEYFFGGAVAGAKVSGTLYRNQDWYSQYESDEYDGGGDEGGDYSGVGGDYVEDSEATTDANGDAVFEFTPKPEERKNDYDGAYDYTPNYMYTLNADVTEAGDKYFSGSGTVKVSQGSVNVGVDPASYIVAPGHEIDVTISTTKVEDNSAAPNRDVDVMYGTEVWSRRTDAGIGWSSIFTQRGKMSVRTGADGKAHVRIPAAGAGSLIIKASTRDENGNDIKQTGYVYVGTDDFEPPPTAPDLAITLDKKLYQQGDTAKVLITAAKPGLTALLTIEGEEVMFSQVVRMDKQSAVITLPVKKAYLPRVTISVVAVQNKKFLETSTALKVDVSARKMQLTISSDKQQYLPGSTATYTIHALGADGKPTTADLSLGVVDEAIYALQEDKTDPVREFYPARPDLVSTNYSFPELYLDGGDKGGDIPIRINFKDTAAWFPSIKTDAAGNASVQVKLPDNLTKWRATLVGVSDSTDVGLAKYDVVVNKPLMIRLQGPKFMVSGDHQEVAAVITNNSGFNNVINVSLTPSGFSTRDSLTRTIKIESGKSDSVTWDLTATTAGANNLVAKAWIDGGPNDGVQQNIDVKPHAREIDYQSAGDIHGSTTLRLSRRQDADPSSGRLRINVSPTIGTSIYDSLDSLIDYPYGCVEQTMSRFLPAMVVGGSLKQVGILRPDLNKRLPDIASQSLAKLKSMQHYDGGWGWWAYDTTDPFMTAYVLDGIKRARDGGYKVSPFITDKAVDWAAKAVLTADAKKWTMRDRLYVEYVLALYGKKDAAAKALKEEKLGSEGSQQLAVAAMTANLLGPDWIPVRDQWVAEIRSKVVDNGLMAKWEPKPYNDSWWWEYDDVYGAEITALPLMALEAITPNDPLIPKAVRHLVMTRYGNMWWSTRDTSFALMAIAWYLKRETIPAAGSSVHVLVNGQEAAKLVLDVHQLRGLSPSVTIPITGLKTGQNDVTLRLEGANVAYYSVDLQQFAVADQLGKVINGSDFTIDRSYHLLRPEKMEDGTYKLTESKDAVTSLKSGDLIQCDLVINSSRERNYVMITDPLPSNCHPAVDNNGPDVSEWNYWYSDQVVYDDRVTFFSRRLPAGRQVISYVMRAESPGVSHALPPTAGSMYNPEDKTSDAETEVEVSR